MAQDQADRPNLVLILVDQWRADCLGLNDHPVVETPHLDALFASGTSFNRAYASVPSCIPARASLLTGLEPKHHGRVGYEEGVPWPYDVVLPRLLSDDGYQTHCVGKMHVSPPRRRMGFHDVELHDGYIHFERDRRRDPIIDDDYLLWLQEQTRRSADIVDPGLGCNGYVVRPWTDDDRLHPSAWVVTRALDFLRRRDPTRPFFLTLSFHRPHPPLDPPAWCLERYERKPLPELSMGDWADPSAPPVSYLADSPIPLSPPEIDRARRAYFAQLTFIDNQINRLVLALSEYRALPTTAFMFCADHGEMLYDHHRVGKALPYDQSARIPFLISPPRSRGEQWPEATAAPIELRDVLPTLCELASTYVPDSVDGHSLLPLLRDGPAAWRSYLHGEHMIWGPMSNQWLTDGREKYVWFTQTDREQLFDLVQDPSESHDLAPESAEKLAVWRSRLVSELDGREEGFVTEGSLTAGCHQEPVLVSAGILDDAALERRAEIAAFIATMTEDSG